MKLRYGTRGSPLALAQSDEVARRLKEIHPSLDLERVVIRTSGDRFASAAPQQPSEAAAEGAPPNVKAMFVKEIEDALLGDSIAFAVHSAKDLPGDVPDGLEIAAYPEREDPRDAYIGGPGAQRWEEVRAGAVIGTASLRRRIQLSLSNPGVSFVPLRGNVDTRLKRLEEGKISGLVLAQAGLRRLGRDEVPRQILPVETVVPAPGQGALAVEARSGREDVLRLLAPLDDLKTRLAVECERAFLKAMGGGCQTPLGAFAEASASSVRLRVFWSDAEGKNPVRRSGACAASPERLDALVRDMAGHIRDGNRGGNG